MKKWKAWAGVAAIFFGGFLIGGLAVHAAYQRMIDRMLRNPREAFVLRLTRSLKLNASQREQVNTIVKETRDELAPIRAQIAPKIEEVLTKAEGRIDAILTPAQREAYEKIKIERRKARAAAQQPSETGTKSE